MKKIILHNKILKITQDGNGILMCVFCPGWQNIIWSENIWHDTLLHRCICCAHFTGRCSNHSATEVCSRGIV